MFLTKMHEPLRLRLCISEVPTRVSRLFSSKTRLFPEELNILYDGKCNVCKIEMDFLSKRDKRVNRVPKLKLTDIESPTYNRESLENGMVSYEDAMKSIHAVTQEGKVIQGVPVFALAYDKVGLGWMFKISKWPILDDAFELLYLLFAKYRTILTRGSTIDQLVSDYESRRSLGKEKGSAGCITCKSKQ